MGPSGSGKTTLLNVLASRPTGAHKVAATVLVNGAPPPRAVFRETTCFVEQDDALIGSLTVRETLRFAARLAGTRSAVPCHHPGEAAAPADRAKQLAAREGPRRAHRRPPRRLRPPRPGRCAGRHAAATGPQRRPAPPRRRRRPARHRPASAVPRRAHLGPRLGRQLRGGALPARRGAPPPPHRHRLRPPAVHGHVQPVRPPAAAVGRPDALLYDPWSLHGALGWPLG